MVTLISGTNFSFGLDITKQSYFTDQEHEYKNVASCNVLTKLEPAV